MTDNKLLRRAADAVALAQRALVTAGKNALEGGAPKEALDSLAGMHGELDAVRVLLEPEETRALDHLVAGALLKDQEREDDCHLVPADFAAGDAPEPGRVYWFAETVDAPPRYYVMGTPGEPSHLTQDPLVATRFTSKAPCLDTCHGTYARVKDWKLRAVEHMFIGAPPTSPQNDRAAQRSRELCDEVLRQSVRTLSPEVWRGLEAAGGMPYEADTMAHEDAPRPHRRDAQELGVSANPDYPMDGGL